MRNNIIALSKINLPYMTEQHRSLVDEMKDVGRDHYHHREGLKDNMDFICLVKANFDSGDEKFLRGHIGGRDDNFSRKNELLDIKFSIKINELGTLTISIDSSDRITTYEQSMKLVIYSMSEMYKKKGDLKKSSGGGGGKIGFYPSSAAKTGRFRTFDKWMSKAEKEFKLPVTMRESFIDMNYNLIYYSGEKKIKKQKVS